ncbi:hypothetical protein [Ktedonobacter robiniae]|uniref:Uncharacterized protein n=1 Tax=Ktedonobacter robiniae TaxID=2778365 RepID=A0ABQ3UM09_9CHLR|nr:hypothetical protein [Ktedonobacter robiniae]GHO53759.1 hypothetical protein KSB_22340 [Ktedonobacter robiniae]
MDKNQSEVATLLQQIEAEYQAAYNGLDGFAMTAPHVFRTSCSERIGKLHEDLQQIVGLEDAIQLVAQTLDRL